MFASPRANDVDAHPSKKQRVEDRFQLRLRARSPFPSPDYLYHLGLNTKMNLKAKFHDLRCVVVMGSGERAESYANMWANITSDVPALIGKTERFAFYKVGTVVFVSHGMGGPSASILLHEMLKLMHYAECPPIPIIRAGTCGGVGVAPGTIVLSTHALNGELQETYNVPILGKMVAKSTAGFSSLLNDQLASCANESIEGEPVVKASVVQGKTMSCDCFYEGQGRLDGAFCEYSEQDKLDFLNRCHGLGVRNIEMEATVVGAFGKQSGIPVACVCCALLNRMDGDQIRSTREELRGWTESVGLLIMRFLQKFIVGPNPHRYTVSN